jgi:cobalamin biosynthesis protein CobD/CbiB
MGLAPLLGFLLDALFGDVRKRHIFADQVRNAGRRLELICRTASRKHKRSGGLLWLVWVVGVAMALAWFIETAAWSLFEMEGRFAAQALIILAILRLRRMTTDASLVQTALELEAPRKARERLRRMGTDATSYANEDIAGATIARMSRALLEGALLPLVFVVFGPTIATGAVAARELGSYIFEEGDPDDPFYIPALKADLIVGTFAGWIGALLLQGVFPLVGGNKKTAFAGWLNQAGEPPEMRLSAAVARGLGLGPEARGPEGGDPPRPTDIQRAVILVWVTALAMSAGSAAFLCAVFRLT